MTARYKMLALVVASLLQITLANAQDGISGSDKAHKDSMRVAAQVAGVQKGLLEKKRAFAQSSSDMALELDTLDKIALLKGRSSTEYLFASVSYKLRQGGKLRNQALEDISKLCSISEHSYECVQARALAEVTDPQMRVKLQSFVMHENNADYANAVADLDTLFPDGPVPEHGLRLRYYTMMGNIEGREAEASQGLAKMLTEIPYDNELKLSIRHLVKRLQAQSLANSAIKRIDDLRYVKSAQNDLRMAIAIDPTNPSASYWQEMLSSSVYYRTVDSGDAFLDKNPRSAIAHYKEAIAADPKSPYAYVGLCRAYAALKDERSFALYSSKALLASLNESVSEQKRIRKVIFSMEGDFLEEKAKKARNSGDFNTARKLYAKALQIIRDDPWLYYDLSSIEASLGNYDKALSVIESAPIRVKQSSEYAHAYALILDKSGKSQEALNAIRPYIAMDNSIKSTYDRIDAALITDRAVALYTAGHDDEALSLIEDLNTARVLSLKSDIMHRKGNSAQAISYAEQSLAQDPSQTYVMVGLCNLYHEDGQYDNALRCANELKKRQSALSLDEKRSLGQLYAALGDESTALSVFREALDNSVDIVAATDNMQDLSVNEDGLTDEEETQRKKAWIRSETAPLLKTDKDVAQELRLALSDYDGKDYSDDVIYTTALRTPDEDEDWLRHSIRTRGDDAYLHNTVVIEDGLNFIRDSGHPGYSDNKGYINVLKVSFPLFKGRAAFQADTVFLNPGALSGGEYEDMFGTIFADGTDDTSSRKRRTNTFAFSYAQDNFKADIGTAPDIKSSGRGTTLVGGASIDFDLGNLSLTPYIYRRAKDNSVLSYFGERDSGTGTRYGAVKKNGIGLSGSYYLGPQDGLWFDSSFEFLNGTNVLTNRDLTMMGGYYHHLIDKPNERFTIAPSVMFMSYAHDLSGYTLGQGGYYSPQLYLSSSLTLRYMRRHENYSYMIEGSGSLAFSRKKAQARYPLSDLVPQSVADRDASSSGDSSVSFGWGFRAALERRVTSRLIVGASTGYSKSDDYSPLNFLLYFRYYCTDYSGDLYMPPAGPVPYTKW